MASALAPRSHVSRFLRFPTSQISRFPATRFFDSPVPQFPVLPARQFPLPLVPQAQSQRSAAVLASGPRDVSVILLSAGTGKRMKASIPKQYLKLLGREIALRSLDVFLACNSVTEIVVVCADEYRSLFEQHVESLGLKDVPKILFANGGKERQDSVANGLAKVSSDLVAVHDGARPLVTVEEVEHVIGEAREFGAALLAVPTKATIKQSLKNSEGNPLVSDTPDRSTLWEAHTPQVMRTELLRRGFDFAAESGMAVTDDVSLVEALKEPVKITQGEYTNIKVTTPEDIAVAEAILKQRGEGS